MAGNNEEPTLELDDGELTLHDDEPTMEIDEDVVEEQPEEADLNFSDSEVGSEDAAGGGYGEAAFTPPGLVTEEIVVVPSAGSFNALLIVAFLAYAGALVVLLYRLGQYSAPDTFPWQ